LLIFHSFDNTTTISNKKDGISSYDSGLRLRHANSAPFDSPIPSYSGSTSSYYPDAHSSHPNTAPLTPLDIQRMESESGAQRQYQLIPDQDYLRQRADAMTQVESNIVELGTIFNKLAVMVNEHRDLVQRVEDNVEDANANVNLSLGVLTDTLRDLQTNRALGMKVLGILVLFIIMFIIFFA
jgi:syntaxin 5